MSQLPTAFDSPAQSPGFLLWQVNNAWQAQQRKVLREFGLTHVQFVLLATLAWHMPTKLTQQQLAQKAHANNMMTSQVVRALEAYGLVARSSVLSDKRAIYVVPTPLGLERVGVAILAVEQTDAQFFKPLMATMPDFLTSLRKLT